MGRLLVPCALIATIQLGELVTLADLRHLAIGVFCFGGKAMPTWLINTLVFIALALYGTGVGLYFYIKHRRKKRRQEEERKNADTPNKDKRD